MSNKSKKRLSKDNSILAFVYFILIFILLLYLFMMIYGDNIKNGDHEMSIFNISSPVQDPNYGLIMKYPEFRIPKTK